MIPVVGQANQAVIAATGYDYIAGEEVNGLQRGLAIVGTALAGSEALDNAAGAIATDAAEAVSENRVGLEAELKQVYQVFPKESFECNLAAVASLNAFEKFGFEGASIVKIVSEDGNRILKDSTGMVIARTGFHYVVEHEGLVYDALAGNKGTTWDSYYTLWLTSLKRAP